MCDRFPKETWRTLEEANRWQSHCQPKPPDTQWRDLREWLARVDALGELKRVTGANSEEDIGAITEMLDHAEDSPCVLFDEIPNFKPGYRVLVNSMGSTQAASRDFGTRSRRSLS